ncbi:hypothetical protein GCM10010211_00430 [Streptomyces albospinus]|uniref:DUF2637 domain-containing protein n=1 Tax=Streptomyces albospinus TaxID=285515 RepID=A0ABQ2UJQ7_9ACTN|nr:hypothetical protein [Streptomyces albospinus]GGU41380.1 hypothetical protein GCM10010211_00430 [Streptomyces albospinus]
MPSSRLPWYAYVLGGLVLVVALMMSAPGEYQLARVAGWGELVAAGMPVCMSVYTAFAVWFVETRRKGEKGRGTAIVGAICALTMTLSGQVVAHWIAAGDMQSSMALTAAVSSVPAIVVGHVAHMIIRAARQEAVVEPQLDTHASEYLEEVSHEPRPDEPQEEPQQEALDIEIPVDEVAQARARRRPGRPGPSIEDLKKAAETLRAQGEEVNGPNLAKAMGRHRRQGSRYLAMLNDAPTG